MCTVIFTVERDHKALQYFPSSRHLNSRLTRWALKLQSYSFTIQYRPGKSNQNADGLSWQAWPEYGDEDGNHEDGTKKPDVPRMSGFQKERELAIKD